MSNRSNQQTAVWVLVVGLLLMFVLAGCGGAAVMPAAEATPEESLPAAAAATDAPPSPAPPTQPAPVATPTAEVISPTTEASPAVVVEATATAVPIATAGVAAAEAPARETESVPAGAPVRLVISGLQIDAPVVPMGWEVVETAKGPVSQWQIPEDEAGHHINSTALGERGNLVISGHNNIYGRVFEPISRAWSDDSRAKVDQFTDRSDTLNGLLIELYGAGGERFEYRVEEFYRLRDTGVTQAQRLKNARFIEPTADDRVTIVTCWPPWNNTHRLVLIARPVSQP